MYEDVIELVWETSSIVCISPDSASDCLTSLPLTTVRLDLHGVLDTLPVTQRLPHDRRIYCCISYVGRHGETRKTAIKELQERIATNQILFGVLVFEKGYTRKEKRVFTIPGSKAWVNAHLPSIPDVPTYFIDDAKEHLQSTNVLCPHIRCIHFTDHLLGTLDTLESNTE